MSTLSSTPVEYELYIAKMTSDKLLTSEEKVVIDSIVQKWIVEVAIATNIGRSSNEVPNCLYK